MDWVSRMALLFELQAAGDTSREQLLTLRDQLISNASKDPILTSVRANTLQQMPQLQVDIDNDKAAALGLSISDVNATLSAAWGEPISMILLIVGG